MNSTLSFLIHHGEAVVFGVALVNQLGLPFPAAPWLLGAGALARMGHMSLAPSVGLAMLASLLAHAAWYEAGRLRGTKILRLVCRVSLEPDACVRKTENLFASRGAKALVIAHFIPGLVAVAQPLAGTLGMPRSRFVAFNLLGSILWAGGFMGIGFAFSRQLGAAASASLQLGGVLLLLAVAAMLGYVAWKVYHRQRILGELRVARIRPEELKRRLDAGETVVVLDLRHPLELASDPTTIPGAVHIPAEQLEARHREIP